MKSDGIKTLVRKLRLCQSARGRKRTRVERLFSAPFSDDWRTTFRRLFLEKGIGTFVEDIIYASESQPFACSRFALRSAPLISKTHTRIASPRGRRLDYAFG
jgi:hypothetical protein